MNYEDDHRTSYEAPDALSRESANQLSRRIIDALDEVVDAGAGVRRADGVDLPFITHRFRDSERGVRANRWRQEIPAGAAGYLWLVSLHEPFDEKFVVTPAGDTTRTVRRDYVLRDYEVTADTLPVSRLVGPDLDREVRLSAIDAKLLEEAIYFACNEVKQDLASGGSVSSGASVS